ncbi:MATE family efflux transporter [Shewanella sp. C32]|uniref:MATE family efflux transporter n=1 Tax=Shewanella electrica TaxID=515560 RepID=A0ABT2FM16_9GAMM|nr:MATE family efflux transporter [Shewanella electrica]MCH1926016.1 MATE family efflux transporter [Shewanella electrica]MCS4557377.1 MATE family efflux transporter [Shewanella electrica]
MNICPTLTERSRHQKLLALALPMILSNITVPLLGLVDTAVIGHLSHAAYLGGVAVGSTIITLMLWLMGFLRMSTTALVAQGVGRRDSEQQLAILLQSSSLAVLIGALFLLLQWPIWQLAMQFNHASSEVMNYGHDYFAIRIWGAPFALLNMVLLGWLMGRQQPKAAMWQLIIANSLNIALDLLFVAGFDWNVKGAAAASVMADIASTAIAVLMVKRSAAAMGHVDWAGLWAKLRLSHFSRLLRLNRDIFIRSLFLQLTFAFITFAGASLGDTTVAANAVMLNLLLLISYALDGIAYYAEAEVGRAAGEHNYHELHATVTLAFYWSAAVALLFSLLFWLAGEQLIGLLTSIDKVIASASALLPWMIALPLLSFGCYLFDGVFIGAAKGRTMRNSMMIASLVVFVPLWYVSQPWQNHGLWLALSGFMLARSATLGGYYYLRRQQFLQE